MHALRFLKDYHKRPNPWGAAGAAAAGVLDPAASPGKPCEITRGSLNYSFKEYNLSISSKSIVLFLRKVQGRAHASAAGPKAR